AICAEAHEAEASRRPAAEVDRAVALSLEVLAWPLALHSARRLARRRRLHAPLIVRQVVGDRGVGKGPPGGSRRAAAPLGARALLRLLPARPQITIPDLTPPPPPVAIIDDAIAATDALIEALTGGRDPTSLPADPVLDDDAMRPVLDATTDLVNAMGRCQVEFAAAAIAALRVHPGANVQQVLVHADRALRLLARQAVEVGDRLVALTGRPRAAVASEVHDILAELREQVDALDALRDWVIDELARLATADAA
ncbi:MAG: hypothetical protein D6798_15615, partial [Deltaproteobacteria bacterium]